MCGFVDRIFGGGGGGSAPVFDASAQQAAADAKATQAANAKMAGRNKRRAASLLATGAGDTGTAELAQPGGKTMLGS